MKKRILLIAAAIALIALLFAAEHIGTLTASLIIKLGIFAIFMYALYLERKTEKNKERIDSSSNFLQGKEREFHDKCQELTESTFKEYSERMLQIITTSSKRPHSAETVCQHLVKTIEGYKSSISEIEQEYVDIIAKEFADVDRKPVTNYAIRTLVYDCREHIHKEAETFRKFGDLMWYETYETKSKL